MYNQDVIDRLNNLTNLYALKNANIKVISKKNEFGDVVKFFAQINSENVIQRITYKASGCTTFVALCSYFCEIVEGNTISKATKIDENDLMKFSKLDDSKTHVYKIILDTFALLIKKYNDGIKKGKIKPCEPIKITDVKSAKKEIKKSKKESKTISNSEILSSLKMYSSRNASTGKSTKKSSSASAKAVVVEQNDLITTSVSQTKQTRTKVSLALEGSKKKQENSNAKLEVKEIAKKEKDNKKSATSKNSKQVAVKSANATNESKSSKTTKESKSIASKNIVTDETNIISTSIEKKSSNRKGLKSAKSKDVAEKKSDVKTLKKESLNKDKKSKDKKSLEQKNSAKQEVVETIVVPSVQEKDTISQEVNILPSQNTTYEQNVEIIEPTQDSNNQLSTVASQEGVVITTAGQKRSTIQVKRTITTTSETKRSEISNIDNQTYVETKKSLEHARFLERSTQIARLAELGQSSEKQVANEMKLSHLSALNETIKNKETNEKMKNNSNSLNSILDRIKLNSINNQPKEKIESKNEVVVESVVVENKVSDNDTKEKDSKKEKKSKDKPKKEKKSLFSWFKK